MYKKPLLTDFLPAERAGKVEIENQSKSFMENKLLKKMVDSITQMLIILNEERQMVYANQSYLDFCHSTGLSPAIGKRPGETLDCIHSLLTNSGGGTTSYCQSCGAAKAINESKSGNQSIMECSITTKTNYSLDLRITATPYEYKGQSYTIFAISDIGDEKRREILERVFFHDILNSAGGIAGLSSVLTEIEDQDEINDIANTINKAAENLVDEIQMQRQLSAAERGALKLVIKEVNSLSLIKEIKKLYYTDQLIADKILLIDKNTESIDFKTDPVLLRRVLSNMIKNALEVHNPKAHVTIGCEANGQKVKFSVHNSKHIEPEVQNQLFKRSFSTKGAGRGFGTYSMKLFGEKYLKGKVWYESSPKNGTTFFIEI